MGCCGDKRKAWMAEADTTASVQTQAVEAYASIERLPERLFEYTGERSLAIRGAATGVTYHFRFPGDRISVDHHDCPGLMAEPDLKPLPVPEG